MLTSQFIRELRRAIRNHVKAEQRLILLEKAPLYLLRPRTTEEIALINRKARIAKARYLYLMHTLNLEVPHEQV